MNLPAIDPIAQVVLFIAAVISVASTAILRSRRGKVQRGTPYTTLDKVLFVLGIPMIFIIGVSALLLMAGATQRPVNRREGDNDISLDDPPETPDEGKGEGIARVIEDRAEKVETEILEEATDDEVGSRGAKVYGLGLKSNDDIEDA